LKSASILILTDDEEFSGLLSACWRVERQAPSITILKSDAWPAQTSDSYDLVVAGPVREGRLNSILETLHSGTSVILCGNFAPNEMQRLRVRYPRLLHVPLREDSTQALVLLASESLRRIRAGRQAKQALSRALQSESEAVLGRYMTDMKHNVNNALTSILGNAELLLLEPGQLSAQSLHQVKTVHSMTLRIHEIMQRFSSLASEMREAENASQAETEDLSALYSPSN
jgi:signal transduction histidine kinase